jgi:O-antigen/teichoic acid export membrane protein
VSLIRNSLLAASSAIVISAARFALTAVLARRLPQAGYGRFAYAQWLVDVAFLVCSLGAAGVASRYVAEFRSRPRRLAALLARWRPYALALPLVASAGVLLGARLSHLALAPRAEAALALWAAANGYWAMQTAFLVGRQRFDMILRANALAGAVMLAGALLLPLRGDAAATVFLAMCAASGAAAVIGVGETAALSFGAADPIDAGDWSAIRGYAVNVWISALLWNLVWSQGEMPIVRARLGDAGVAQYDAALTLFGGGIQGMMLVVSGIGPHLTALWGSGLRDEALATARKAMDVQLLLSAGGALVLICAGPELLALAFGAPYRPAAAPLAALALGVLAMSVSSHNHLLQIATDARFTRDTTFAGLVLLFAAAAALTPRFGLFGAALARAGTMLALALVSLVAVARRWGRRAVPLRNAVLAAATAVAAVVGAARAGDAFGPRAALLGGALAVLFCGMRDESGRLLAAVVPGAILSRGLGRGDAAEDADRLAAPGPR